jgi:hypothetical protein
METYLQPLHDLPDLVVCAVANVSGQEVAPPGRRAVTFTFEHDLVGGPQTGWTDQALLSRALGPHNRQDATLLAAVAMSGAAFASAMGRESHGSINALLTVLNLRLGVWLPSPDYIHELTQNRGPWVRRRHLGYLFKELFDLYSLTDRFVYVTDGGQFENLGLYQLLARQCTTIYAFDASGDSPGSVTSLLESMVLARLRLGVEFTRVGDSTAIAPNEWQSVLFHDITGESAVTTAAWASVGVLYPDGTHGVIRFGKARLWTGLDDEEISNWTAVDEKFPSDSTVDQFLDPTQFAAYVRLGELVADHVLGPV